MVKTLLNDKTDIVHSIVGFLSGFMFDRFKIISFFLVIVYMIYQAIDKESKYDGAYDLAIFMIWFLVGLSFPFQ